MTLPAFNPGSTVQFRYKDSDELRTVVYETMRASAAKPNGPRTWLLVGRAAERDLAYRSFALEHIRDLQLVTA